MNTMPSEQRGICSGKNKCYYLHSAITLLLMFVFGWVVPPFGGITQLGMQVLGVFLGLLYGWTFVEMLWPSLISFIALGVSGAMSVSEAFASGFGNNLTLILLFVFIFAAYMEQSGLNRYIAHWFISRRIAIGRPWVFTGLILFCAFFLGAMTNLFASMVICWSVFYRLADLLGYKPYDKYVAVVLFGVLVGATLGSMAVPFQAVPVVALGLYENITGAEVNFMQYTAFCTGMSVLLLISYVLLCKLYQVDPLLMVLGILFATHVAFSTPAASSQAAMLYGNSAWVSKKQVFTLAMLFIPCAIMFYLLILIPCLFQLFA